MTNPNNAIGTNAAYGGRTSANAFNDVLSTFTRGVLSGWACVPNTGLTVSLGGDGTTRDVAIAQDAAGNNTTINNISGSPVDVTISAAPASNSRIDSIVAYVDNPPTGSSSVADNPSACGIIAVAGTPSASPTAPTNSAIRSAITADGASGTTAYYVVLANITIASGTTTLTASNISAGSSAVISAGQIADNSITVNKIDFTTLDVLNGSIPNGTSAQITNVPGKYIVLAFVTVNVPSTGTPGLHLSVNNTVVKETYCGNGSVSTWETLSIMDVITLNAGDTMSILADRSDIPSKRSQYIAVKISN